jgi:hypothetical protein
VGVYSGPDINENGLILAFDGANFNSFKGESTTNEIVSVTWGGDGTNQSSFTAGSTLVTDQNLTYKGYETYLWSPATSRNCYLHGSDLSTSRTSTTWTFSCYIKREDGAAITSLSVYMYYPSSDGASSGTIEDVGNGWYRVSRTRTGTDNYLSLVGFTGFAANIKYYLSGAQVEKKPYATTSTTTNTTRGITVATGGGWKDLTGKGSNGELVNGVRENSDNLGSLIFDGMDDYVNCGALSGSFSSFTIITWFYPTVVANYNNVLDCNSGYYSSGNVGPRLEMNSSGTLGWVYSNNTGNNSEFYFHNVINSGLAANTWHCAAITYNGGANISATYYNGNATGVTRSTSGSPIGFAGTFNNLNIGRGFFNGRYFQGRISQTQIYNRTLTASEIQQNFNSLRGRFGL